MIRNATKLTADRRSAAPYAGCRYTGPDGRVWTFWSMAPGRKDHHWVTDGVTFALADEAGLVAGARAMMATARSLADLDQGDLRYQLDFRSLYASILSDWLGADDKLVLGPGIEKLAGLV